MARLRIIILLAILSCAVQFTSTGQTSYYRPEIFGTRDGLHSSKIYSLKQSHDRRLWIGTELGLSVYDGYIFTNFQYTTANETIGRVLCITEDKQNGIWIGGDKGLFYLHNGLIEKISFDSRTSIAVEALLTDATGNIWVGDLEALYKIEPAEVHSIRQTHKKTIHQIPFAEFTKRVFSIAADNRENIYLASFDGVFKINKAATQYEIAWNNPDPVKFVRSVAAISPDSIVWNRLDGHPYEMRNGKTYNPFTESYIGRIVFTHRQKAYALTTSGVGKIKDGLVYPLVSFNNITNNAVAALIDEEENIWVGSWEGLQKFSKTSFKQYTLQHSNQKETFSFLERKNGELLFGSNRGLVFTKKNESLIPHKNIPPLFPLAEVMCMYEDDEAALWAGSGYQGICRLINNKLTNWKAGNFLKDDNCEAIHPAPGNNLFACTENGVTVIDPHNTEPMIAHYSFQKKYTRPPELFGCFQTGASGYWFYGSQGLYALRDSVLIDDSIINMPVRNLYINKIITDRKGNIWVATLGKGLLLCHLKKGKIVLQKQYDKSVGLTSDIILSVLADKNDNIWWGDYMSLSVLINPGNDEQIITYNEKDGLIASYYQTLKLEQQRNGTIWGLTSMGVVSFHPDSVSRNDLPPVLLINSVTVSGDKNNYFESGSAIFTYDQNSLRFNFAAICLTDATKVRYAYRLKQLDSNWTYTTNRNINFNFLQPGTYTFELKACNNNNVWTRQPLQYNFSINPPFWQTWWFRLLVLSVLVLAFIFLFKRRIKIFKAKAAIKQQMTELESKALRAQMNPHFIFNSLNAIQELIVTKKFDEGYQYLSQFSKLLRMVLNNSEKNSIPLSAELEMIKLQLSLESLRFKNGFSYSIHVDENTEPEMTNIPPLLLQPYVENAVWHGLRHKDGERNLSIRIKEMNGKLNIEIEDNGVGRQRAEEIRKQKLGAEQFESKGSALSKQRIEILNQEHQELSTVEFIDLKDENNLATGTKVLISLPINLK